MNGNSKFQALVSKSEAIQNGKLAPLIEVITGFARHRGRANAAYIAFYLILSLFPFLLAFVAIIGFLPWDLSEFVEGLSFFPPEVESFLLSYVLNIRLNSGFLVLYSVTIALWSSSRAVTSIQDSLDQVFENKKKHFVKSKLMAMLYNLVFIFLLIIVFSLPSIIDLIRLIIERIFGPFPALARFFTWIRWIIVPLTLPGILALLYMRVPSKKLSFWQVWPGALFTSVSWMLLSNLFPILVSTSKNALYGALNTFLFMALFFQFLAQTLIYGAEINRVYARAGEGR